MLNRKRAVLVIIILLLVFSYFDLSRGIIPDSGLQLVDINQGELGEIESLADIDQLNWQNYEYETEITGSKEQDVEAIDELNLNNDRGDVAVRGEDRDNVKTEYKITISSNDEEILSRLEEEVELNKTAGEDTLNVSVDRSVPERERVLIEADITVRAPRQLVLAVQNNYGVTEVDSWRENIDVDSNYSRINLSDIDADNLELISSYADVNLQAINSTLFMELSYTDINIGGSSLSLQGEISYGALEGSLVAGDSSLQTEFADVDLDLEDDLSEWGFDVQSSYGDISTPPGLNVEEDGTSQRLVQDGNPVLEIRSSYGDVNLR